MCASFVYFRAGKDEDPEKIPFANELDRASRHYTRTLLRENPGEIRYRYARWAGAR